MTRASYWLLVVAALLPVAVAGCSRGGLESEVSGTVTLDGKPVGPGSVVYGSADSRGNVATGPVQHDGAYIMKTSREVGLAAGHYRAAVSIREMPTNLQPGERAPPGKSLIPEKYEAMETSGLEFEVKPGGNTINIELTSK